jgi:hypothetical protein
MMSLKMSLSLAVEEEVCSLSLHRSGQDYISLHSLFSELLSRAREVNDEFTSTKRFSG